MKLIRLITTIKKSCNPLIRLIQVQTTCIHYDTLTPCFNMGEVREIEPRASSQPPHTKV
ncbi:MAG: hypothetical protein HZB41_08175 [Ignavibacteriae bacterium]|nr:hypothetical protein [Ignavibacteriota bacterium]